MRTDKPTSDLQFKAKRFNLQQEKIAKQQILTMEKNTFACAINCMDGRIQDAVKNYVKDNYHVDYVDIVTEPGPNKILAENLDMPIIENIKKRVEISIHHHGAKTVAIVGHFGCAGNPVEKEQQLKHLKKAKEIFAPQCPDAEITLLWVEGDWKTVEKID